ncbi:MAG: aminopeptidase [Spirochaetales bacterium]|nr:aminopeptidase [Spirochaetales bacterium]
MYKEYYDKIADILLHAINLKKGDKIQLSIDYDCREAAKHFVRKAYERGALYIELNYHDPFMRAEAIRGSNEEIWFPEYLLKKDREAIQKGWKSAAYLSESEADVYEGLPAKKSSAYFQALGELKETKLKAAMSNQYPWTLTYLPSESMAHKAFPDLPVEKAVEKYWEAIIQIMRLDQDDPVAFWDAKMKRDAARSAFLNDLSPEYLHFQGPGTDLMVGANQDARWVGGYDKSIHGEPFMSNVPTDEIFTTPDFRKVNGKVSLTKPFTMHNQLGPIPEEAWFEFKEGRVIDYGAAKGVESLNNLFETDERNRYIGELALVDPHSPFAETGILYYNGLYDENAACHLALGKAYPFTMKEPRELSDKELQKIGFNTSLMHEDMMIGGLEVNVTAILKDGTRKPIIKDGDFLI